jgi:hypothetical protein
LATVWVGSKHWYLWVLFKWYSFVVLLLNVVSHRWSPGCMHDTSVVDYQLFNRTGVCVTQLNAGIPSAEPILYHSYTVGCETCVFP